jgi:hypothetical protein
LFAGWVLSDYLHNPISLPMAITHLLDAQIELFLHAAPAAFGVWDWLAGADLTTGAGTALAEGAG